MNFLQFTEQFPNEKKVIEYFITMRYPKGMRCNHCGSEKVYPQKAQPRIYRCNDCDNSFSIFKGTIFEKTTTDLRKWMYAIHLFLNAKKGVSAMQLQREVGVTYKTAWRMLKQIRAAMGNKKTQKQFEAIIEMDETYVGGKPRKGNKHKKDDDDKDDHNKRGRGSKKAPVVGVLERDGKKVHAKVALPNAEGKKLTGKQLLGILNEVCKGDATVMTDQFRAYNILNKNFIHLKVDHSKEYVSGDIHCNSMESFWAILKRGVYGIYHQVSVKYLQQYVNEFCFRYNNRDIKQSFDLVLKQYIL